ncbi:ABC transporter F family member 3 [Phytophthora cinnamomi]|uniref:ABC transporter F family member 3 n=1 Tax=Phytophthora cinnamomi TaxID=4785 RepID=UPI00355A08C7|nr:ABC transporter F family member 3 [Phytophthora cinnamomi]
MPPVPPERRGGDSAAAPAGHDDEVPCSYCVGISVYTKAMWRERQGPECKGIQVDFSTSRERLQEMRERAAHPRKEDFTFMGVGLSVYSPEWMEEGKHLPYVKGIGVIAVHTDNDELMKQIEDRKRIKRELQKNAGNRGDLQDGNDADDGDDLVDDQGDEDLFDFNDGEATDDGQALVENEVVRGLKTPRGPAVVPASITMAEVKDRAVEKAKYSVNAMYKFWERRLDGISDRYVDSCRRLTEQMEKQVVSTPHNVMWLVHRIEEYVFGKDDGGKK